MANEFVAKNGLISQNNSTITGSLTVTAGITGSLQGTASWANNALTASVAPNYVLTSVTSSMLTPYLLISSTGSMLSSYLLTSATSSMLQPYLLTSTTASMLSSYLLISSTGSMLSPYLLTSATSSMLSPYALSSTLNSYLLISSTSSMLSPYLLTSATASMLSPYALSSALNSYLLISSTGSMLSPYVLSSQTSSFVTNSQTSSMTVGTASRITGGTLNYIPLWSSTTSLGSSVLFQNGSSIGLGTTSPNTILHISGSSAQPLLNIENAVANGYSNMRFTGTGKKFVLGVGNASETLFSVANKFFIYDDSVGAMRAVVDTSGNVGINTTGPTANLDVNGNVKAISFTGSLQGTATAVDVSYALRLVALGI